MAKKKKRRNFTPEAKVAILKEHLVDKMPVSEVCDKRVRFSILKFHDRLIG